MKIVQINSVYGIGSTGRIAMDLQDYMIANGIEARTIYGYGTGTFPNTFKMQSNIGLKLNIILGRITGHHGFYNYFSTKHAIAYLKNEKPDVIHLHNIHGYYINVPMLMNYLKKYDIPVAWTFHDCWPFTGHCCYFDDYKCERWKIGCEDCAAWGDEYSIVMHDRSHKNWVEKKDLFCGLKKCILVSPSKWLADFFQYSFMKDYPFRVIHNGINVDVFKPTESDFKHELGIENKKLILGIAPNIDGPKGGRYMIELAKHLGDDYAVVILSLKTSEQLPNNVYALPRTDSTKRLAEIYSAADVFVNPTLHDNYPTVNLEAISCGTPVVTFKTGGSPEGVVDGFGSVVEVLDINAMTESVKAWTSDNKIGSLSNEIVSSLSKETFAEKYLSIYRELLGIGE